MSALWRLVLVIIATGLVASQISSAKALDPLPGMRAVSLSIDPGAGVGGFILPGDRVDLVLRRTNMPDLTEIVLRDIRVLAIDLAIEKKDGYPVVAGMATLEVSIGQAQQLAPIIKNSQVRFSLMLRAATRGDAESKAPQGQRERTVEIFPPVKKTPDLIAADACQDIVSHFLTPPGIPGVEKFDARAVAEKMRLCNQPIVRNICRITQDEFKLADKKIPVGLTCGN